ncbi:MAG: alpha/beta fold hydrolase [Candidatus Omnitrophota bacterium]
MNQTRFEYVDRGKKRIAVLIPGWAMDRRIFQNMDIDYNYLVPVDFSAEDFFEKLAEALGSINQKAILIGWSFGGLLAAHFTVIYPELIERVVLVSVKENYSKSEIDKMKEYLERNKTTYLKGFYRKCFSGQDTSDKEWFNTKLLDTYIKEIDKDLLNSQLDFLKYNYLPVVALKEHLKKLIFIHGDKDAVIPLGETNILQKYLPGARFVTIKNTGHVPFLCSEFKAILEKYNA